MLPSIGVTRPLVENKNPGEVGHVANSSKQLTRQVVHRQAWVFGTRESETLLDETRYGPRSASRLSRSRALRRTRSWFESSLHVPRKVGSRARQLSLHCSLWHSQHLGCLKDRETVRDAELKCSSQAGRQQCAALPQVRSKFRIATLVFRAGPRVRQSFG